MERKVDVTGTMAPALPGWQERVEQLAKVAYWEITVHALPELWDKLTPDEQTRLSIKMGMAIEATKYMLAGMVKGTVKYASDDWTLERWMAHLVGEGADQMNYQILLFNAFHKMKEEQANAAKWR
jgi:hypothetical protein